MAKKLTLSIDADLISFAHSYSKENDVSISKLFEQYLNQLKEIDQNQPLHPKTATLYGLFQDAPIPDKKELRKAFNEKSSH